MSIEARTLSIPYGSAKTYFTTANIDADASLGGYNMPLRLWLSTSGTATYNSGAMTLLYPNATAKPVKAHINTNLGVLGTPAANAYLKFGDTTVYSSTGMTGSSGTAREYRNIDIDVTHDAISNSNKSTSIVWNLTQASTGLLVAATLGSTGNASSSQAAGDEPISGVNLSLYFNKWTAKALIGTPETDTPANAITYNSITVSNANPWDCDTVQFKADLTSSGIFKGWYSDEACTQLVSNDNPYSTTITADTTLYAYISAKTYDITVVKDSNITSTSVVQIGETSNYKFTAYYPENVEFLGWYSDATKLSFLSTDNPATISITSNTTAYTDSVALEYEVYQGDTRVSDMFIGNYQFS